MQDVLKGAHLEGNTQSLLPRYHRLSFFLRTTTENNHIRRHLPWPGPSSSPQPPPPRNWGCREKKVSPLQPIGPNPHLHLHLHAPAVPCRKTSHKPEPHPQGDQPPHLTPPHPLPSLSVPETFAHPFVSPQSGTRPRKPSLLERTYLTNGRAQATRSSVDLLSCWACRASSSPTSQLSDFSDEQAVGGHCLGSAVQAPPPSPLVSSFPLLHQC